METNIIVSERSANLRALGRDSLRGKWGLAALGTLLYLLLTLLPSAIIGFIFGSDSISAQFVSTIYSIVIAGPMTLGYTMFAISIFRKRETSPAEVLYGFEKFGKALGLYIVMSVFVLLWMLLFIVPGIIASYRYSMAFFILADNPEIGIMDALAESKRMMRGNKWKFFCLGLSFIGWTFLALLTCGIGMLWLTPYMQVSMTAFYEIARGGLRSVSSAGGNLEAVTIDSNNSTNSDTDTVEKVNEDPITVYKDKDEE